MINKLNKTYSKEYPESSNINIMVKNVMNEVRNNLLTTKLINLIIKFENENTRNKNLLYRY